MLYTESDLWGGGLYEDLLDDGAGDVGAEGWEEGLEDGVRQMLAAALEDGCCAPGALLVK